MGHMTMQRLIPVAALFALAACGQGGDSGDAGGSPDGTGSATAQPGDPDQVVYQGALTVLQDAERDLPELCGAVAESYPPQCGGLPVAGWDWDSVEHEEAQGVRWGLYLVTGTFDGDSLVLTEDPVPASEVDMDEYPHLRNQEPEFGDPAEDLSDEELQAIANELLAEFPDNAYLGRVDEEHGVAVVGALLVTPEMEAYVAEHYAEDVVAFTSDLKPAQ